MANFLTVLIGAVLLFWPALYNGYPLTFSDTGGFLEQALMPDMGWDKPWIYGPFLTPFHARLTLWPAAFVQPLLLSAALWLTQICIRPAPGRLLHILVCIVLATISTAPWFASLLMPDIFAPITVLALYILAFAPAQIGRLTRACVTVIATIAIASHLAHLMLAAICIATLALFRWRSITRTLIPLAASLVLLLISNIIGNGIVAISPYGADFALARLVADGPARTYLHEACPTTRYRLCDWQDRLPTDSDAFLWDPNGPVWADGYGPIRIAPEAAEIVRQTILHEPGAVLAASLRNTARQLTMVRLGDTLAPAHLDVAVLPRLKAYFPPAEAARFQASKQDHDRLRGPADVLNHLQIPLLIVGTLASIAVAIAFRRSNPPLACLASLILVSLVANAFATGALSGPHDRYEARIAWLVLLPPLFTLGLPARRRKTQPVTR